MADIASDSLTLSFAEAQSTNRWYYEKQRLGSFPSFRLLGSNGSVTAAEGTLDTQNGNTYALRIDLTRYPFALPFVYPRDWVVHPDAPHKFNNGAICIMRSDQWRQHFTVALVIAKAAIWLGKYEIWKRNGHVWPGLGQPH
jgi:hypothetical protein